MAKSKSLVLLALILWFLLTKTVSSLKPLERCPKNERDALLSFKERMEDPGNRLSTWRGEDCCAWRGVVCSNKSGHVTGLELGTAEFSEDALRGKLNSSLLALSHLDYLDLSGNYFVGPQITKIIGSMSNLRYLNLSGALLGESGFGGSISLHLGNLSNLLYLDLNNFHTGAFLSCNDLSWLPHLSSLEYLDMSAISVVPNWAEIMAMLPSIKYLYLIDCSLQKPTFSPSLSNLSNLIALDVSSNYFRDVNSLNWVWNLTSLKHLDMSSNKLKGIMPWMFNNLYNIKELDLSFNPINIDITELVHGFPRLHSQVQSLNLGDTNLVGNLSSILKHMTSLETLDLSNNNLTGTIPSLIRATKLSFIDVSVNFLDGVITKDHFANLPSLHSLYLSGNSLRVEQNWFPSIALREARFGSCDLGPKFPPWVKRLTHIINLEMSNTNIIDKVPDWFWNFSSHLIYLDLSNNQISGGIPKTLQFWSHLEYLYLQNNLFEGSIPSPPHSLLILDLSNNSISGHFPMNFVAPNLSKLFLQDNLLNGTIPASICLLDSLNLLDLSSNHLWGSLPKCWMDSNSDITISSNLFLNFLLLRNNNLSDTFPSFLRNCQNLRFLDLSYNKFSGNIPPWIGGNFWSLSFLLVRSNMFSGNIPVEITKMNGLRVLDLAHNNFSGNIPSSINNLQAMTHTSDSFLNPFNVFSLAPSRSIFSMTFFDSLVVVTKGISLQYNGQYMLMISIDLSFNSFTGEIPEGITSLIGLVNLNLSGNHLIGNIPERIGAMQALQSLDLSNNDISGEIPSSIANLTSLSYLNLSYNNLSGRIPSGNQLQTLDDPSIYIGNSGLCGPPLSKDCSENGVPISQGSESIKDEASDAILFILVFALDSYSVYGWCFVCFCLNRELELRTFEQLMIYMIAYMYLQC